MMPQWNFVENRIEISKIFDYLSIFVLFVQLFKVFKYFFLN